MEQQSTPEERVRLPQKNEVIGIVVGMVGGSRMRVACKDGKERLCRIPGKLKNTIWVNDGDVVIVKPWDIEGDKKGDVVWRYKPLHVEWLKQSGYL
jgi:translation initiation factor 1A